MAKMGTAAYKRSRHLAALKAWKTRGRKRTGASARPKRATPKAAKAQRLLPARAESLAKKRRSAALRAWKTRGRKRR